MSRLYYRLSEFYRLYAVDADQCLLIDLRRQSALADNRHGLFSVQEIFGSKDYIYIVLAVLFTGFLVWKTEIGHRFSDATVNAECKGLLLGIVLIPGASAILLPFFFRSKFFAKYVF